MVSFAGPKSFRMELASPFSQLCSDINFRVRETIASGFHQVVFTSETSLLFQSALSIQLFCTVFFSILTIFCCFVATPAGIKQETVIITKVLEIQHFN